MDRERRDPKTILQSAYIPCACLTFESPSLTETFVFVFVLLLVFFGEFWLFYFVSWRRKGILCKTQFGHRMVSVGPRNSHKTFDSELAVDPRLPP